MTRAEAEGRRRRAQGPTPLDRRSASGYRVPELAYHQGDMDAAADVNFSLGIKGGLVLGGIAGLVGGTFFGRWLQKQVP